MSILRVDQLSPTDDSSVVNVADIGNYLAQVSSFSALRSLVPTREGVPVKLRGYRAGSTSGGGDFVGHLTSHADDGGLYASSGGGYHWERVNYGAATTPEMFGAVGDGTADDTAAVRGSINSGACVLGVFKNYRVTSTINIPSGAHVRGAGSIVFTAGITALSSVDTDNITLENFRIVGSGKGGNTQTGLQLGGNRGGKAMGITADSVNGTGISFSGGRFIDAYGDKFVTDAVSVTNCTTGVYIAPNLTVGVYPNEYIVHLGIQATNCNTGIQMGAGNHTFAGGHITGCIDGMDIINGYNSAHGTITGMQFNHNSRYNLHAKNASAGLAISACTFFADNQGAGLIYFEDSRGFVFDGCLMESSVYTDGGSSWNKATNCYNNGNFAMLFAGTNGNRFIVENWVGPNGPYTLNNEGWDFVSVKRATAQNLTAGSDTTLVFDALNQKNIQQAYNLSNGQYTAPFTGFYSVRLAAKFVNVTSGFCTVKINGGVYTHMPIVAQSGGMCAGAVDVYLTAGQVMTITANTAGSSPQHDGTGSVSTLSIRKF